MHEGFQKREQDHQSQKSHKLHLHVLEASQLYHLVEVLLRALLHVLVAGLPHHLRKELLRVHRLVQVASILSQLWKKRLQAHLNMYVGIQQSGKTTHKEWILTLKIHLTLKWDLLQKR